MKVLILEDERQLREDAENYLSKNGYRCEVASTVKGGRVKLDENAFACVLIDLGLPDGSGMDLVKYIKTHYADTGIIITSARNGLEDKVEGLRIGADDYLTKPYHLSELGARIYSVIRRRNFGGQTVLKFDGIEINTSEKKVIVNGSVLYLTKKEYDILVYLASNPTFLVTKEALADAIWGDKADMATSFDFVYSQMKNLKKKIVDAGLKNYIKSVYGMGYRFKE